MGTARVRCVLVFQPHAKIDRAVTGTARRSLEFQPRHSVPWMVQLRLHRRQAMAAKTLWSVGFTYRRQRLLLAALCHRPTISEPDPWYELTSANGT